MSRPQLPTTDDGSADPAPLLTPSDHGVRRAGGRGSALRTAARMIRRVGNRQVMGESSMRVREAAAEQIEERQSDWAYSRPIVVLDLLWNSFLLLASLLVLALSRDETTSVPLRLWIVGHGIQCLVHMVCVCLEYRRRQELRLVNRPLGNARTPGNDEPNLVAPIQTQDEDDTSVAKHLESANTMFTFIWWIMGFYWVSSGGSTLEEDAPDLYWICIAFLALDVFFVVICVVVACLVGIAVCFCLPCIIAILYAVADQEGASKEDIERLPRFMFRASGELEKDNGEIVEPFWGMILECNVDKPEAHTLPAEHSTCVICHCAYEEGSELRQLPCGHLFHSACVDKWLYMNATCPLCRGSILKNIEQIGPDRA